MLPSKPRLEVGGDYVLRVVARRIWLRTDLHGLSVVLNMLRTVIFILRAQLSLLSQAYR